MSQQKRTPLYQLHCALGAKMVSFAGYEMPLQYKAGIKQEHLHTRRDAGLFDISHMGQFQLAGPHAASTLEQLTPGNITGLAVHKQRYTVLTNPEGGIIDDIMITNTGDYFFIVVNAACKSKDFDYLQSKIPASCQLVEMNNHALLALQGPKASDVIKHFSPEICELSFMSGAQFQLNGIECFINRCGYTGEDGFEISVPNAHAKALAENLLAQTAVEPIGLGARDSLRLEAGLCLYGHDLDNTTTPIEAGLDWVVSKSYLKAQGAAPGFPGAQKIMQQMKEGAELLRVGLKPQGKVPVREATPLLLATGETVGRVTSGGFGPTVAAPVAMGYVNKAYSELGTELWVNIRNKNYAVEVVSLPFVPHRYYI